MTDKKNNFYILFILTVLISGSGWIFVRMQLKYIPPDLAVCYRFFLAGMALLLFSWARGEKFQKFPLKKLPWLCGFGFSLYYSFRCCGDGAFNVDDSGIPFGFIMA